MSTISISTEEERLCHHVNLKIMEIVDEPLLLYANPHKIQKALQDDRQQQEQTSSKSKMQFNRPYF